MNLENDDEKWLIIASVLCSDATCQGETEIGDPTETALIRFSQKNGMQAEDLRSQYPRLAEIPFDSDRKLMSTLNQTPQGKILFTKGAADVLTERMLITTEEKEKIHKQVEAQTGAAVTLLCRKAIRWRYYLAGRRNRLAIYGLDCHDGSATSGISRGSCSLQGSRN